METKTTLNKKKENVINRPFTIYRVLAEILCNERMSLSVVKGVESSVKRVAQLLVRIAEPRTKPLKDPINPKI